MNCCNSKLILTPTYRTLEGFMQHANLTQLDRERKRHNTPTTHKSGKTNDEEEKQRIDLTDVSSPLNPN